MLLVAPVREEQRVPVTDAQREMMADDPDLRNRVNVPRSTIPAVTHVDYSARLQTVDERAQSAAGTRCCGAFTRRPAARCWSTPASTSAASRSSARRRTPIAASWAPRWTCWCWRIVILLKEDVAEKLDAATREKYLAQFQLD